MHDQRFFMVSIGSVVLLILCTAWDALADDPIPEIKNLYRAPDAVLTVYQVKPQQEVDFQDALVKSGPFNDLVAGVANQKLLSPLPTGKPDTTFYYGIDRYYGTQVAESVRTARAAPTRPFLNAEPTSIPLTLVEHMLGDWGWEKQAASTTLTVKAFENPEIFQQKLSTLSFFKIGFTGQVGLAEIFDEATELTEVRRTINARREGLTGASIFKTGTGRYVVYSEYFKAPPVIAEYGFGDALKSAKSKGAQAGIVVQNYIPR